MNIADSLRSALAGIRTRAGRLSGAGAQTTALSQFLQPELPPSLEPWRRIVQPVVAGAAVCTLLLLLASGAVSLAVFMAAAGLIYAILTRVFGIDFELAGPVG